jgi:hypothetical protein
LNLNPYKNESEKWESLDLIVSVTGKEYEVI